MVARNKDNPYTPSTEALKLMRSRQDISFSLRSRMSEAVESIPWGEVLPTTKDTIKKFVNPLDWSRGYGFMQQALPEQVKAGLAHVFMTPHFQAERHTEIQPFVDAGESREVNRMQIILDMLGYQPGKNDTRSNKEKIIDSFTKWQSGQASTDWEGFNRRMQALTKPQKRALDLIFAEGDAMGSEYTSLAQACMNPRLKKGGVDQAVFQLYRDIRKHIDGPVAEARLRHMENMMLEAGIEKKQVDKHIADYRNEQRKVRGWMSRDHGEGKEQVAVYHVFDANKMMMEWVETDVKDGKQYYLPYYPGNQVMMQIEKILDKVPADQRRNATMTTTPKGAVIITLTGKNSGLFDAIRESIADSITGDIKVMSYMRRFQTELGAKSHAKQIAADYAKAMPRNYIKGHRYVTDVRTTDGLSEDTFREMRRDFAVEQALVESIKKSLKKGEITKEEAKGLKAELVRNTAEVLMGRAAGRYQIRRAPYLIEGYQTENTMGLYQDYMMGVSGLLSKAQYAMQQMDLFRKAGPKVKGWAEKYITDTLRNMGLADRISGDIRAFATLWFMGFKVSSAAINATQNYTLGFAELGRMLPKGKSPMRLISVANVNILSGKNLTTDEQQIFDTAIYKQQEMATAINEMSGHNEGSYTKAGKTLHNLTGKALALFQQVELMNRKAMILAAYRAFRSKTLLAGAMDVEALQRAMKINDSVNFNMGRHNLPGWARGAAGRTFYSLQSFTWNNLNWLFNRLTSGEKRDMVALLRYAGAIFVLGGAAALPGGDELDKLYRRLKGRSLKLDFETWSSNQAARHGTLGELVNAWAWHGVPAMAGVNISNAVRLQIPVASQMLADGDALEAAGGVPGALWGKGGAALMYLERGDVGRALESAAPEAVAGPLRAIRQATEGATTSHGKVIFDETGKPLKYSTLDAVKRGLGFMPIGQSKRSELTGQLMFLEKYWKDKKSNLMDRARAAVNDPEKFRKLEKEFERFNVDLEKSQVAGIVTPIDGDTVDRALQSKPNERRLGWQQRYAR